MPENARPVQAVFCRRRYQPKRPPIATDRAAPNSRKSETIAARRPNSFSARSVVFEPPGCLPSPLPETGLVAAGLCSAETGRPSLPPLPAADDPEGQARLTAFVQGLQQLGWTADRNVRIDYRWAADHADLYRRYAAQLVALAPDIILASSSPSVGSLQQATRDVPIVFANVADPVGAGFVDSLARPGGNATGFTVFEYGISGKWLELLKQIAPPRDTSGGPSESHLGLR